MSGVRRWDGLAGRVGSILASGLVVVAILVAQRAMATPPHADDGAVPPGLADTIAGAVTADSCVAIGAAPVVREALQADFPAWRVVVPSAPPDACLRWVIDAVRMEVRFVAGLTDRSRRVLERTSEDLLRECYAEDGAVDLLRERLAGSGIVDPVVRTDGPRGGPVDRYDEVMRHLASGCFVYAGLGWTPRGVQIFYLAGGE